MEDFTEKPIAQRRIYKGKFLTLWNDDVKKPDGKTSTREYLQHPGAVMIIPVTSEGKIILVRQYRYAVKQHVLEFPAGKIDEGESPYEAAQRELLEETGYKGVLEGVNIVLPCVAYSTEKLVIFKATNLEYVGHPGEEGEFVEVITKDIDEALEEIDSHEPYDIKFLLGLVIATQCGQGKRY